MNYFIDQEFIEGIRKPLFGKKSHFIDLISIGIVAQDGRKYSAICSEYSYDKANQWVKDNVILPLYKNTVRPELRSEDFGSEFVPIHQFHELYGKSKAEIAYEIIQFIHPKGWANHTTDPAVFYGYYADYDWVLFCSLFGTMGDLPAGFPMYCRDLKQTLDEKAERLMLLRDLTFELALERIQHNPKYPVCDNEHDALSDAQFNKDLYEFLLKL